MGRLVRNLSKESGNGFSRSCIANPFYSFDTQYAKAELLITAVVVVVVWAEMMAVGASGV